MTTVKEEQDYWRFRELILKDIINERFKQDKKWGVQRHSPAVWMTILTEEVGEAAAEAMELEWIKEGDGDEKFQKFARRWREELIQCAAVCVAAIEEIDENIGL